MSQPLSTTARIRATALSKAFGRRVLWSGLNFVVEPGQMVAVTGPSGSGKSTLLNCLGLLQPVTGGSIRAGTLDLTQLGSRAARLYRRDQLGYLFQNYALIDNASVLDNLRISVDARPRPRRASVDDMRSALEHVGLKGREHDPIYQMSGGEQQRVALARILVRRSSVVLADEPTGALDRANGEMVVSTLRGFADNGACVLVATHSPQIVDACDRAIDLG